MNATDTTQVLALCSELIIASYFSEGANLLLTSVIPAKLYILHAPLDRKIDGMKDGRLFGGSSVAVCQSCKTAYDGKGMGSLVIGGLKNHFPISTCKGYLAT